jgi:hypothetical protein
MLKTRLDVAKSIATPLIEMEAQVDAALLSHATLQVALIEGRRKAKLPLDAGQEGLEKISLAFDHLLAARKAIHEAHYVFRGVQDKMGIGGYIVTGDTNYGDTGDTPRSYATADEAAPVLTVVRAA